MHGEARKARRLGIGPAAWVLFSLWTVPSRAAERPAAPPPVLQPPGDQPPTADPRPPKSEVSSPPYAFDPKEIADPRSLALRLRDKEDPVGSMIGDRLEKEAAALLLVWDDREAVSPELKNAVVAGINKILDDPGFHKDARLLSVPLPEAVQKAMGEAAAADPAAEKERIGFLNRRIIEETLPKVFQPPPPEGEAAPPQGPIAPLTAEEEERLARWVRALERAGEDEGNGDEKSAKEAAQAREGIFRLGRRAAPFLAARLEKGPASWKILARLLMGIGEPTAGPAVVRVFREKGREVPPEMLEGLKSLRHEEVVTFLLEEVSRFQGLAPERIVSDDLDRFKMSLIALDRQYSVRSLSFLVGALGVEDDSLRRRAVSAILNTVRKNRVPEAFKAVVEGSTHKSPKARREIAGIIGLAGIPDADSILVGMLQTDTDPGARDAAALMLAVGRHVKQVPALVRRLRPDVEREPAVRKQAAFALGYLNTTAKGRFTPDLKDQAIEGLIEGLKDKEKAVRQAVQTSLEQVTGVQQGSNHTRWRLWWEGVKEERKGNEPESEP